MSYILDALKKAEEDRSHGKAPALFVVQAAESQTPSQKRIWPWIVAIALIVINVVTLFYWLLKNEPSGNLGDSQTGGELVSTVAPAAQSGSAPAVPVVIEAARKHSLPPVTSSGELSSKRTEKAVSHPPSSPPETQSVSARTAGAPVVQAQAVAQLTELPLNMRGELPKMVVGMHMFSARPSNRLVNINDKPLHEGDELIPGLKVLEIMPDGIVFGYKGYRFKKGIAN